MLRTYSSNSNVHCSCDILKMFGKCLFFVFLLIVCVNTQGTKAPERRRRADEKSDSLADALSGILSNLFGGDADVSATAENNTSADDDDNDNESPNDGQTSSDKTDKESSNEKSTALEVDNESPQSEKNSSSESASEPSDEKNKEVDTGKKEENKGSKSSTYAPSSSSPSEDETPSSTTSSESRTTKEPDQCYMDPFLTTYCADLPNDFIDLSFWDLSSILFADPVINALLLECKRGEWCLHVSYGFYSYWEQGLRLECKVTMNVLTWVPVPND